MGLVAAFEFGYAICISWSPSMRSMAGAVSHLASFTASLVKLPAEMATITHHPPGKKASSARQKGIFQDLVSGIGAVRRKEVKVEAGFGPNEIDSLLLSPGI
jgi:hypothetical protein